MIRALVLSLLVIMVTACTPPQESGVKVIVGARLEQGGDQAPIDYSVVVIAGGVFRAVGTQSAVPVPKGSDITRGLGMTIRPLSAGDALEAGRPANLILEGGGQRREMRNGEWVQ